MMQIASVSLFSYWKDSVYPPCAAAAWSGMHKDNAIAITIPSFNLILIPFRSFHV